MPGGVSVASLALENAQLPPEGGILDLKPKPRPEWQDQQFHKEDE